MESRPLFKLAAIAFALAFAFGCSNDTDNSSGSGGGGGGLGDVSSSSGSGSNSGGTSSPSGAMEWTVVDVSGIFDNNKIDAITYGNGKFVAVGHKGKMAYSSDGINWTAVVNSPFGTSNIDAIAFGNGTFVAGGYYDRKLATSTDGVNWELVKVNEYEYGYRTIAFGNGKFVANRGNVTATSTDGVNWTTGNDRLFSGVDIDVITYGGGKFVAGTCYTNYNTYKGNTIAYSTDGITWTEATNTANYVIAGETKRYCIQVIAYGNGKFVSGGEEMAYSTDGVTWKIQQNESVLFGCTAIAWGNSTFVCGTGSGKVAYSPDGVKWTEERASNYMYGSYGSYSNTIAYGNGTFVAGSQNGKIAYSKDGSGGPTPSPSSSSRGGSSSSGGSNSGSINGTYTSYNESITLNNGSFESSLDDDPAYKGTYAVSGSMIVMTVTHFHGNLLELIFEEYDLTFQYKWYNKSEFTAALRAQLDEDEIDLDAIDDMFQTWTATIRGNTLTIDDETYTKAN